MTSAAERLSALRAKLKEAREENLQAVEDESKIRPNTAKAPPQQSNPNEQQPQRRPPKTNSRKRRRSNYTTLEVDSADEAEAENDDDRLRSMKRRSEKLKLDNDGAVRTGGSDDGGVIEYGKTGQQVGKEGVRRMVDELRETEKKRDKFQRRRTFDEDRADINFINEGNRAFNRRLDRHFDKFESVKKIKENLERGTG